MDVAHDPAALSVRRSGALPAHRFDLRWLTFALCIAVVAYLALVPLGFLLWQSFRTPQTATRRRPSRSAIHGSPIPANTLRLFWHSVQFAIGTAIFAFVHRHRRSRG